MNNIMKEVLAIVLVVGGLYWWIDRQADQRFDRMVDQFEEKQRELEKRLTDDFKVNTDKLLEKMEEERKVTEHVLDEFRKQAGASDPSGISGEFLRDND